MKSITAAAAGLALVLVAWYPAAHAASARERAMAILEQPSFGQDAAGVSKGSRQGHPMPRIGVRFVLVSPRGGIQQPVIDMGSGRAELALPGDHVRSVPLAPTRLPANVYVCRDAGCGWAGRW